MIPLRELELARRVDRGIGNAEPSPIVYSLDHRMSSRLVLFLSAEKTPGAIRSSLDPARFDVAEIEGDETRLEVNGMSFQFASEDVPQLHSWHLEQARWEPGERARAESARFALAVETELEEPPLKAFREQLAVALAAGGDALAAIYDESAERLLAAGQARTLVAAPLAPRDLFSIHSVGPGASGTYWVHSHGLARARVPELDLLSVPENGREAAGELLDAAAALLLSHGVPPRAAPFPVGEGLDLVLLPLDEALARTSPREAGGRESRDGHREEERVVLAPASARSGGSPSIAPLLPRVPRAIFFQSPEDTERMRLVARERWSDLEGLFAVHARDPGWVFLVKLGYEPDRSKERPEGVAREHLWFRVRSVEKERVEAVLESTPSDIASLKAGDLRWHSLDRLTDWLVVSPDRQLRPGSFMRTRHVDP